MEDLKRAVALLLRRSGAGSMSEREFVFAASMDLRWFPPKDAQRMLEAALRAGLLTLEAGRLRPAFEPSAVDVPLDFVPTTASFPMPEPPEDMFAAIVGRIVSATGLETKSVVAEVNQVQQRMGIDIEAAALLVGRARGVAIEDFLDAAASRNIARGGPPTPQG